MACAHKTKYAQLCEFSLAAWCARRATGNGLSPGQRRLDPGDRLSAPDLIADCRPWGSKDVFWTQPGAPRIAVTTDTEFFEENADSMAFWTPGNPAFPPAPVDGEPSDAGERLGDLLHAG